MPTLDWIGKQAVVSTPERFFLESKGRVLYRLLTTPDSSQLSNLLGLA